MYFSKSYKSIDKEKIAADIRREGFNPLIFSNDPGDVYERHVHPETKLLAFLEGSMDVTVGEETYHCEAGDELIIAGNTPHAAIAGKNGCTFYWSEKLM